MMIGLLFVAQLAVSDSLYSSGALRELVAAAAAANRRVPESLRSYEASVESEVSLILQPSEGPEVAAQVEQLESLVRWLRTGEFEQRVVGYRVRSAGLTMSSLSYTRSAWTVPVLYGDRLSLFFGSRDTVANPRPRQRRRSRDSTVMAIHPLSANREQVYRFSGGDTVAVLRLRNRTVAIRRVFAEPTLKSSGQATVFRGEIDIDADRMQIVRMRGRFLTVGPRASARGRLLQRTVTPVAYVELINGEVGEQFWLPTQQRIEAQVSSVMTGDARSVFRVISNFRNYRLNALPVVIDAGSRGDTLRLHPHRLTTAPNDSLSRYNDWQTELGESSSQARATDFDDLAPQEWRPTGPPVFEIRTSRFSDIARFNRVEGVYTGMGAALRFRDAFPGLTLRAHAGYAWSEVTLKGGMAAELKRRSSLTGIAAARSLANTNDFLSTLDGGATIPAFFASRDDYDYVDRRSLLAFTRLPLGNASDPRAALTITAGLGADHGEVRRLTKGVFGKRYNFIQNRDIHEGNYRVASAQFDFHPEVTGEFIAPGIGAVARYEGGVGDINWQRIEGRITARRNGRILTHAARVDAGMLLGNKVIPPQQLFELGGTTGLPGYEYKEFAGDRAALARGFVMAALPYLRAPIRIGRRWFLPAPSPALSFGLQAGWTVASSASAVTAIQQLGPLRDPRTDAIRTDASGSPIPLSRPTGGVRSSADVGFRFFGGALTVGVARALDHDDSWRFLISGATWQ